MRQEVFWILLAMIVILGGMLITIAIMVLGDRKNEDAMQPPTMWRVELWNILRGYRMELQFENTYIMGRASIAALNGTVQPYMVDNTVSREHCMLYEQDGQLYVWNMSVVNPTVLNGYRMNAPQRLMPGDRIELGNSVFLVTNVSRI